MKIIKTCSEMMQHSASLKKNNKVIGLVPTMGALHDGHLSLIKIAREKCDYVVMSIFVNPTQFGPSEDFEKYPRQFEHDCQLAESVGCDCVFAPTSKEMYPENYNTYIDVENITENLCGASRPGHFRGVATVVLKLFNITMPNVAIFGAKDAQQLIVIKRMVSDLNLSVNIIAAPIVREEDGLALSSRNVYLTPAERPQAAYIYKGICAAKKMFDRGERDSEKLKSCVIEVLKSASLIDVEYVEIVDDVTVKPITTINNSALLAVACRTQESKTRLIDNLFL